MQVSPSKTSTAVQTATSTTDNYEHKVELKLPDMPDHASVIGSPVSNQTRTLQAWFYTLLLKTFSYRFAGDRYNTYNSIIRNPLAFFSTICTALQSTELLSDSIYLFYIYFMLQIICNILTVFNLKMSFSEKSTRYDVLARRYEKQTTKVRDLLNANPDKVRPEKVKKLTKKLEAMIMNDDSVPLAFEERAKNALRKNRRMFKMAGINFTGDTDENTPARRQSTSTTSQQTHTVSAGVALDIK